MNKNIISIFIIFGLFYIISCRKSVSELDLIESTEEFELAIESTPHALELKDKILYITERFNGLILVDVRIPRNPKKIKTYESYSSGMFLNIFGDIAVITRMYDAGIIILDISQPLKVNQIGSIELSGVHDCFLNSEYLFIGGNIFEPFRIFYAHGGSNPTLISEIQVPGVAYDIEVINNYCYIASFSDGLQIVDISEIMHPRLIGNHDTERLCYDVEIANNIAYLAASDGLHIVNVENPYSPELVGFVESPNGRAIKVSENLVYFGGANLSIIDISDVNNPLIVSKIEVKNNIIDLEISQDYVYLLLHSYGYCIGYSCTEPGFAGIQIINLSEIN